MTKSIYYYETLKNSLKNFLLQKGVKIPDVIHQIAADPGRYVEKSYKPKIENLNKITINLSGDKKDFLVFEKICKEKNLLIGPYMGKLIYNYMYVHKDDEPKKTGKKAKMLAVYVTTEEWEKLKNKIGSKSVNEYIRSVIL